MVDVMNELKHVYYWNDNRTDWENILESYLKSLLVRELFIVRECNVRKE